MCTSHYSPLTVREVHTVSIAIFFSTTTRCKSIDAYPPPGSVWKRWHGFDVYTVPHYSSYIIRTWYDKCFYNVHDKIYCILEITIVGTTASRINLLAPRRVCAYHSASLYGRGAGMFDACAFVRRRDGTRAEHCYVRGNNEKKK